MTVRGPVDLLTDITVQSAATPIAAANGMPGTLTFGVDSHGYVTTPSASGYCGFRGRLTAALGNTVAIVVKGQIGTINLKAGETTGFLDNVDLNLINISCGTANQVLHVSGVH